LNHHHILKYRFLFAGIFALIALAFLRLLFVTGDTTGGVLILEISSALFFFFLLSESINQTKAVKVEPIGYLLALLITTFIAISLKLLFDTFGKHFIVSKINYEALTSTVDFLPVLVINAVLLAISVFYLTIFRHLFYFRRTKAKNLDFNAMLIFMGLTGLTSILTEGKYKDYQYFYMAFLIVTILLMIINCARIGWITFLEKRQKLQLLVISVVMIVLFALYQNTLLDDSSYQQVLKHYSKAFLEFHWIIAMYGMIFFIILFFTTLFHLPTADVIDKRTKEISSLHYFSELINRVLDTEELSETITELALNISGANASWLLFFGNENKAAGIKGVGYLASEKISNYLHRKTDFTTIKSPVSFDLKEFYHSETTDEKYDHAYLVPVSSYSRMHGVLVLLNKNSVAFDQTEKNLIKTFADYAAVAIENSRLLNESIEKERLERELDVARQMQRKILPEKLPELPGYDIEAVFIPAFEVGGDYYDFFRLADNKVGFVIADVSGKGISAAFVMAELKGVLESFSTMKSNPKEILVAANSVLKKILDRRMFITAMYGILNPKTGDVSLVRAGHCPALHKTFSDGKRPDESEEKRPDDSDAIDKKLNRNGGFEIESVTSGGGEVGANKSASSGVERGPVISDGDEKGTNESAAAGEEMNPKTPVMVIEEKQPVGFGLGMNFTGKFEKTLQEENFVLKRGEQLVMFTDGVNEMKNEQMEDYGIKRLKSLLLNFTGDTGNELASHIVKDLTQFAGTKPQHDDITLLIIKRI